MERNAFGEFTMIKMSCAVELCATEIGSPTEIWEALPGIFDFGARAGEVGEVACVGIVSHAE